MNASRPQPGLSRFTLPNGLRVVLDCRFPQPRVAIAVHYGTGFRSEPPDREGFAHLFEHLMFRGSASLPEGRFYEHVHRFGAHANGTTHQDYTDYYQVVPAQALERALFAEADRMRAPLFTEAALAEQLRGVEQEIRQAVHDRPYGGFPWPVLSGVMFRSFANAHDGYGDVERLRSTTVADCADFFAAHYVPGNAVLTIVGASEPEATRELVERHFAGIAARPLPLAPVLAEPRPAEERWVECTEPGVAATALAAGYRLPDPDTDLPGYLAHAVLARLTAEQGPPAAGLPPVSTSCGFFGPLDAKDPDALVVTALLRPGTDARKTLAALTGRWADWADRPPADAVRQTVGLMVGEHHRLHGNLETRCRALGRLEVLFGQADLLDLLPARLAAVGPAEVARAAGELAGSPASALVLRPGPVRSRPRWSSTDKGDVRAVDAGDGGGGGRNRAGAAPEALPPAPYGVPVWPRRSGLHQVTWENGTRVVAVADRRVPSVEVRLRLPLGPAGWRDHAGPDARLRDALARTRAEARAAALGGSIRAVVDGQWCDVTGCTPAERLPAWLAVLAELTDPHGGYAVPDVPPTAPPAGRPTAQRLMDDALRRHWLARDTADGLPGRVPSGSGPPLGDPRGGVLVLLGDLDPEQAVAAATAALSDWASASSGSARGARRTSVGGRLLVLRDPAEPELHLTLCAPEPEAATGRVSTTEPARYLATAVFGGYFGSRLAARLRAVTSGGYEAYCGRDVVLDTPRVFIRARVAPRLAEETLRGVREELRRAGDEPFTEAETEAAREFCTAQALGAFDSPVTQADLLRQLTAAGRDPRWLTGLPRLLAEVPAHEVARAGRELFAGIDMDTVLLGAITPDRASHLVTAVDGFG
ncbi:insulinase family protein [Streptomyces kebangsaanensis]|uniref:Insulinase family protein n=1 Tax=Streptomyces kebangsaanensis TaxID=864058 RepID=A0ABW6KS59_9ACTN